MLSSHEREPCTDEKQADTEKPKKKNPLVGKREREMLGNVNAMMSNNQHVRS